MTLTDAKAAILAGAKFTAVYSIFETEASSVAELDALKEWFVREPAVPVHRDVPTQLLPPPPRTGTAMLNGRSRPSPAAPAGENTGKYCDNCGGARIVRTGSCETCLDCGSNEGCG